MDNYPVPQIQSTAQMIAGFMVLAGVVVFASTNPGLIKWFALSSFLVGAAVLILTQMFAKGAE
jgi:hypothetical protein